MLPAVGTVDTITRIRAGSKASDYGTSTIPDWDNATELEIPGCSVQPDQPLTQQREYTVDRDNVATRWKVFAPPGSDVTALDRVRYAGEVYEVDGEIEDFHFPPLDHMVVRLRRSEG